MTTPAIVLMTDPSRCNLGDVHYLVQALLEMQQMGEHAIPQAFCDHPAAARDFIEAYVHAYPRLVLEDRAIPTPDHLQSLITNGQIGPLGRPPGLAPLEEAHRPAEQNGANGIPIVVLTLGGSQALLDALQQTPTMRESIRLIDIVPDADPPSMTIADVVATRGADGESWADEGAGAQRPALDEVAGASTTDATSLALHDDPMNLNVVEVADAPGGDGSSAAQDGAPLIPAAVPASVAAQPAPPIVAEPAVESALPTTAPAGAAAGPATAPAPAPAAVTAAAEPVSQPASQPIIARPDDGAPVEPADGGSIDPQAPSPEPQAQAPDEEKPPAGHAADKGADKDLDDSDQGVSKGDASADGAGDGRKRAAEQDDDVYYPPVGSLIAAADIVYPALDQGGPHGALRELARVLLDDGILDPDLTAEILAQRDDLPVPARQEAILAPRAGDNGVRAEDRSAFDQDGEEALADSDSGVARPLHDSDL